MARPKKTDIELRRLQAALSENENLVAAKEDLTAAIQELRLKKTAAN